MIRKLENKEIEEIITTELFNTNGYGKKEVFQTIIENTGKMITKKPTLEDVVNKINELVDAVNLQGEEIQKIRRYLYK